MEHVDAIPGISGKLRFSPWCIFERSKPSETLPLQPLRSFLAGNSERGQRAKCLTEGIPVNANSWNEIQDAAKRLRVDPAKINRLARVKAQYSDPLNLLCRLRRVLFQPEGPDYGDSA